MSDPGRPVCTRLVIGPKASMSSRQALGFFAGMCLICLGIGTRVALARRLKELIYPAWVEVGMPPGAAVPWQA